MHCIHNNAVSYIAKFINNKYGVDYSKIHLNNGKKEALCSSMKDLQHDKMSNRLKILISLTRTACLFSLLAAQAMTLLVR